ncbi:MAG TPA: hypothetical protein VIG34_04835 [Xanthobacteraceae bacterium]|jgi:hypothetical protein
MRRPHRKAHRLIWPVLALVLAFGFVMALMLRAPAEPLALPQTETRR